MSGNDKLFSNAIHLTRDNFVIQKNGEVHVKHSQFDENNGCVMIYAPWCPHCQMKDKLINKMSDYVLDHKNKDLKFKVAVADGNEADMKDVLMSLGLQGYPTFYHVVCNGKDGSKLVEFTKEGDDMIDSFVEYFSEN